MTQKSRHFIREWRKARGLTLEALSGLTGISAAAISRIETGGAAYTEHTLHALAQALRCEPADLIMRDPTDPEGIWSLWDRVPAELRPNVRAMLEAIGIRSADDANLYAARPDQMTRTDRLRAARTRNKLSVQELAEKVGFPAIRVRGHERGQRELSADAAEAYAKALGTTPEWILFGKK